jgi:ADP-ribosylglycohydrolase
MSENDPGQPAPVGEAEIRQAAHARLHPDDPALRQRQMLRHAGCLLGGAIGDALGAPVEFLSLQQIRETFGPLGIRHYAPAWGRLAAITDDTQMMLFTAEGLLRAWVRHQMRGIGPVFGSVTDYAYARWMRTQGERAGFDPSSEDVSPAGWLIGHPELFAQRAPGMTCLSALRDKRRAGEAAVNDSKGCGGVMRAAPVGMLSAALQPGGGQTHERDRITFELGCEIAGLTHGHRLGQLPAGYLAVLVSALIYGVAWKEAHQRAMRTLPPRNSLAAPLIKLLRKAVDLAHTRPLRPECVTLLGQGWVAEEALAIAVYCAGSVLAGADVAGDAFDQAVILAVNHDGDSDSTGAITVNIVGAALGRQAIAAEWLEPLELRGVIEDMAADLATVGVWEVGDDYNSPESDYWWRRYPGG